MKEFINKLNKNALLSTSCLSIAFLLPSIVFANPEGGVVSAGKATISNSKNMVNITQQTEKAVIDWRKFDIAPNETTKFNQPSSSSITLNRVNSTTPSNINGQLTANGNVIIVNQNGVMFGPKAKIDVNGIIATSIDIDNDKFMGVSNKFNFNKPGKQDAQIINKGTITAKEAGLVGMVAPSVINNGIIVANAGSVQLASGETFAIDMYGDKLMEVAVSDKLKTQLIANNGLIQADGGKVLITAAAGKEIVDSLIEIQGEIKAATVKQRKGEIIIYAEGSNAVKNNITADKGIKKGSSKVSVMSAKLNVSGKNPTEGAGKVLISADIVELTGKTTINASGRDGLSGTTLNKENSAIREGSAGGDIKIGGDYLGKGDTPTAKHLYIGPGVLVLNEAVDSGDAGRSIFWSDNVALFYGNIYARALGGKDVNQTSFDAVAGGSSGDGGFVETSGHGSLDARGYVNLTASNGKTGTYLLDPDSIKIYGNVTPQFISTDGSINLKDNLKIWLDASNKTSINLIYITTLISANGTKGVNTLRTLFDAASSAGDVVAVGNVIRLGQPISTGNAANLGEDTYIIRSISGNTLTLDKPLSRDYEAEGISIAHVQNWKDLSGNSNDARQYDDFAFAPIWVDGIRPKLKFDGIDDSFKADLTFLDDPTNGYNGVSHTSIITANTSTYGSFYQQDAGDQSVYVGFRDSTHYRMDYWGDILSPNLWGDISPSGAFVTGDYNILTYKWIPDGGNPTNYKQIYANSNSEGTTAHAGTIGWGLDAGNIGGNPGAAWGGDMREMFIYNKALSVDEINLLNQHSSAKWNVALSAPGSGSAEAEKAIASDGYSVFTSDYLNRLSKSTNIELRADSSIVLDLQGSTIRLAEGKSFSLMTNNGDITALSPGKIITTSPSGPLGGEFFGNIAILAGGQTSSIDLSNVALEANNGTVLLVAKQSVTFDATTTVGSILLAVGSLLSSNETHSLGNLPISPISISGVINDKVYDRTTTASFSDFSVTAPATIVGDVEGTFINKNAGYNKTVSLTGLNINIDTPGIYGYDPTSTPVFTAKILKKPFTMTGLSASDKVYDGTAIATISGSPVSSDILEGDIVNFSMPGGAFSDKNVGSDKAVVLMDVVISGNDFANYSLNDSSLLLTASITPKPLLVKANHQLIAFGDTDPTLTYSYKGLVDGETQADFTGNLVRADGRIPGIYKISQGTLEATGNYTIGEYIPGTFIIRKRELPNAVRAAHFPNINYINNGIFNFTINNIDLDMSEIPEFSNYNSSKDS